MKLIVGLGNPGEKYEHTRHNLGFMVVEQFLKDFEPIEKTIWSESKKLKSDIADIEWKPKTGTLEKVILAKPKTYMNNSGMAISLLVTYYRVSIENLWVVHDDIDLPVGSLRIRFGGSSGGHRGIESIIERLGTEKFWRVRLGIGRPGGLRGGHKSYMRDIDDFVLEPFAGSEKGKVRELIKHASKAIAMALEHGLEETMNRSNTK